MSYYITRQASKWAKSEKCSDAQLITALQEMERGLTGNALGASLYKKKRIAVPGAGKSGGWRVIVATKFRGHCSLFMALQKMFKPISMLSSWQT